MPKLCGYYKLWHVSKNVAYWGVTNYEKYIGVKNFKNLRYIYLENISYRVFKVKHVDWTYLYFVLDEYVLFPEQITKQNQEF